MEGFLEEGAFWLSYESHGGWPGKMGGRVWGQTPPIKTSEAWVVRGRMLGCGNRERKQLEVVLERSPEPPE